MTTVTRGWPAARRKAQAERIRMQKPWLRTTGPRTEAGKRRVALNALKHNRRSVAMLRLRRVLARQRHWTKLYIIASEAPQSSSSTGLLRRYARRNDDYGWPTETQPH